MWELMQKTIWMHFFYKKNLHNAQSSEFDGISDTGPYMTKFGFEVCWCLFGLQSFWVLFLWCVWNVSNIIYLYSVSCLNFLGIFAECLWKFSSFCIATTSGGKVLLHKF